MGTYAADEARWETRQAEGEAYEAWLDRNPDVDPDDPDAYAMFLTDMDAEAEEAALR